MGLFDFSKKKPKTPEEVFRERIKSSFESSARLALSERTGDALFDGMLMESAIGNLYQQLRSDEALLAISVLQDFNMQQILDEEYNRVKYKYLK